MAWVRIDGVDWQVLDGEATDTTVGWTVAHGLLDESAEDLGALRYAAGLLRRELGRPVEIAPGDVAVPEVLAQVAETTLTVTVRGRRDAVLAAWERLPGVVDAPAGPTPASPPLEDDVDPVPVRVSVWGTDVAARCGVNGLALTWLGVTVPDALNRGRALLRRLSPFAGEVPGAFFTDDAELPALLAGRFTRPVRSALPARRGDGDAVARPGSLEAPEGPVLFSVVVPRGLAGLAAADVLTRRLDETVEELVGPQIRVGTQVTALREHLILTLQVGQTLTADQRDRAIGRLVVSPLPVPDRVIDEAVVARAEAPSPTWVRERRVLGLPEERSLTASDVRAALGVALRSVHLARPRAAEPMPGFEPLTAELPQERHRTFSTWIARQRDPGVADPPAKLLIGGTTLRAAYHGEVGPGTATGVSLADAVFVVEDEASGVTVVDAAMRRVSFVVDTFQRRRALRSLLDRRLAGVPRAKAADAARAAAIRTVAFRSRRWLRPLLVFGILMLAFVGIMAITQATGASGPVQSRVSVGEKVTLGNGSTVTVRDVDSVRAAAHRTRTTFTVEFCAGEDSRGKDVSPSVQQRVGPGDFALWSAGASRGTRVPVGSGELGTMTLARGQCTQGKLTYDLDGDLGQARVAYANGFKDDVVWYLP
ncbi:hypothetical protein [Tersicoccus sp. Bi-70]|uniref:hypothetical protein n=1 Tax=Tersicoccus sp. Bi-70 TaxID=1897634 RepID=UPI000976D31F|nr:hypothetical protein [Tersicoccus sp. Bi-70]OMH30611.1 hypothetical protein BGP79_11655 [Tersicoccus sp. Bi-70]